MAAFTAAIKAFFSKEPACWASIVSTLAALACPARSSGGASAASWASLAFEAAGGCALLVLAKPSMLPVTWAKAGSSSGRTAVGATGGCSSWSADMGAGAVVGAAAPPVTGGAAGALPAAAPLTGPRALAGSAPALPSLLTAGTGLGGGVGFLALTDSGP